MSSDSHLSEPRPEKDSSAVRQHHRLAKGEKVSGSSDPYKGAASGKSTVAGQSKKY